MTYDHDSLFRHTFGQPEHAASLLHRLTNLLPQFVRPALERDPADFVQRWLDLLRALWEHPEGRAEGREEGLEEGRIELLLRLCRARFGAVPAVAEARLRGATIDQLDTWAERLLTARSLGEMLG